jgi:hypothetical protein
MRYVNLRDGVVVGEGAVAQPGWSNTLVADDDSRLLAFLNPPPSPFVAGVAVVSTGTPGLSATYAIDPVAQGRISGIAAGIAARNRVPGGGANFPYRDAVGTDHTFTGAQFLDFAAAIEDFVFALGRGQSPATPLVIP